MVKETVEPGIRNWRVVWVAGEVGFGVGVGLENLRLQAGRMRARRARVIGKERWGS